jgi:hypothetical protein
VWTRTGSSRRVPSSGSRCDRTTPSDASRQ